MHTLATQCLTEKYPMQAIILVLNLNSDLNSKPNLEPARSRLLFLLALPPEIFTSISLGSPNLLSPPLSLSPLPFYCFPFSTLSSLSLNHAFLPFLSIYPLTISLSITLSTDTKIPSNDLFHLFASTAFL